MTDPAELTVLGPDGCPLTVTVAGTGPLIVLLHAGGPDRHSLDALARHLRPRFTVAQPDIRGYGGSRCPDPARHTWAQYTEDLIAVLDCLRIDRAVVAGTGLGSTIALRSALGHADRLAGVAAIGVEDIEDDAAKEAERVFLDEFADRGRREGLPAAWAPILTDLPPVVGAMVADAIPRSDVDSIVAAAAIGHDRAFARVEDLAGIDCPALVFAGTDWRHPRWLAERAVEVMPRARLALAAIDASLRDADDLAGAVAPELLAFATAITEA